eukprot:CAMPEP_0197924224 /NCGR_PEP_ID=MMETSP1439-20131203/95328_1 /TAXON_ID=66791 /ORGANISM="Gonyaulax spinifera, Strain CCMP409" /LENGTH=80 /DNA_ID=CAMNT_0043546637 /DNA_START=54 /DNA_END=293 /DNA_ORIENTATION=+
MALPLGTVQLDTYASRPQQTRSYGERPEPVQQPASRVDVGNVRRTSSRALADRHQLRAERLQHVSGTDSTRGHSRRLGGL